MSVAVSYLPCGFANVSAQRNSSSHEMSRQTSPRKVKEKAESASITILATDMMPEAAMRLCKKMLAQHATSVVQLGERRLVAVMPSADRSQTFSAFIDIDMVNALVTEMVITSWTGTR